MAPSYPLWSEGCSNAVAAAAMARALSDLEERGGSGGDDAAGRVPRIRAVSISVDSDGKDGMGDPKAERRRRRMARGACALLMSIFMVGLILTIVTLVQAGHNRNHSKALLREAEGGEEEEERLLELAERIVTACSERNLIADRRECQRLCPMNVMCCFQEDEYSCRDDANRRCAAFAGCEALVGLPRGKEGSRPKTEAERTEAGAEEEARDAGPSAEEGGSPSGAGEAEDAAEIEASDERLPVGEAVLRPDNNDGVAEVDSPEADVSSADVPETDEADAEDPPKGEEADSEDPPMEGEVDAKDPPTGGEDEAPAAKEEVEDVAPSEEGAVHVLHKPTAADILVFNGAASEDGPTAGAAAVAPRAKREGSRRLRS